MVVMSFGWPASVTLLLFCGLLNAWGGGSGLNVIVVVNQSSSNSVALGNYYRELRQIPPQNVLRISWNGGNVQWTSAEFNSVLRDPLATMVSTRGLTNQANYVLLSMDIPYRVVQDGGATSSGQNSTTSALFYGFKTDYPPESPFPQYPSCSLPDNASNSYAGSEMIFESARPDTSPTNSYLAMMLTGTDLATTEQVATRGFASDGSAPALPFVLGKSDDLFRNIRYLLFDNALFNLRLVPGVETYQTNIDSPTLLPGPLMGYQNGHAGAAVPPNLFAPGALADSLTSYGGAIFESTGQTSLLAYLAAGAAGSYGTVVEPCNYLQKFPSPQVFFYQARGFNLAESYYQGLTNPYQGLLVGEPLAAPFAVRPQGGWNSLPLNAPLSGTTNLSVLCASRDSAHPIGQVDLFIDGTFSQTLTNVGPRSGNILSVNIRGYSTNYTVPDNATLSTVASQLASRLNATPYSTATGVRAYAHGDRIELHGTDIGRPGGQISVAAGSSQGTAGLLTTHINTPGSTLLDTTARGLRSYVITNAPQIGDYLELLVTRTNGQTVSVSATNNAPGTNLLGLASSLFAAVNSNAALAGADGLAVEDIYMHEQYAADDPSGEFNIRPRSPGWPASQIQVTLLGSPTFRITPPGEQRLDENAEDLQPRQHLYISSGLDSFPVGFNLNTASLPDGYHELTAAFYEGSHVHSQGQARQIVKVQNTALGAILALLYGGTNTDLSATLRFAVSATGGSISNIELFSTGGSLTNTAGQSTASFLVPGSLLGPGLHPFYAIVTAGSGETYRTATQWVRLIGPEPRFALSASGSPPVISWTATAGRPYEVLSSTNVSGPFLWRATVTPSNSTAQWMENGPAEIRRFYRVKTAN